MSIELLVYAAALAAVAALLWFANTKGRRVRLWRLMLKPSGFAAGSLFAVATSPAPGQAELELYSAVALFGIALGYGMARGTAVVRDGETGVITSRMSPLGLVLFIAIFAGRFAFRAATNEGQVWHRLAHHSAEITVYTNAAMVFLCALFAAHAWEIWRKAAALKRAITH